jgi:RNase P/RNase MRP subunit p30
VVKNIHILIYLNNLNLYLDNYSIFAFNTYRKGTVANNNTNASTFKQFDLKQIYSNNSLKFLNSSYSNEINWDNIKQLSRLTIEITDSKDLYQFSNPNNALKSYDILAIEPKNERIFELACSDVNVDIITINFEDKINFVLKKTQINAAIERGMFFEIVYGNLIKDSSGNNSNKRSLFISNVLLLLDVTKGKNVIISSGVNNFYDHRSPYDIMIIFDTIFEVNKSTLNKMLNNNCEKVILKSIQRKYFKTVLNLVNNTDENDDNNIIINNNYNSNDNGNNIEKNNDGDDDNKMII